MTEQVRPLPQGAIIGILGGGQLGRMLAMAASRLGFAVHVYCPDPGSPAFSVAAHHTIAAYDDDEALKRFAEAVAIVTYEFENVPATTAETLAALKPLAPGVRALAISQDRLEEKRFLTGAGVAIAPFAAIDDAEGLERAMAEIGLPAVLKTVRLGYDGKGQRLIRGPDEATEALAALGGAGLVLEGFVDFASEISVIVARGHDGVTAAYDPAENRHEAGILRTSTVPAAVPDATLAEARTIAAAIAEALDYVGVLGVEFFVTREGEARRLLVNEIAPRVHNSGHWTEAGAVTDQFEQHIRAIAGWPLGPTARIADVEMRNLIGDEVEEVPFGLGDTDRPHLYGKAEARPGRKMGHVNRVMPLR